MPYVIGLVLSLGVAIFARVVGLDRERAFYATVLIVVASYYVVFTAVGGESANTLLLELLPMTAFVVTAVIGFRSSEWIIVGGLAGHGVFDAVHGYVIHNSGVPASWPAFCGAYDVGAAIWLAWLMKMRTHDRR